MAKGKYLFVGAKVLKGIKDSAKIADKANDVSKGTDIAQKSIKGISEVGAGIIEKFKKAYQQYEKWLNKEAVKSLMKDEKLYQENLKKQHDALSAVGKYANNIGKTEKVIPKKDIGLFNLWH